MILTKEIKEKLEKVENHVCDIYGITVEDLFSKTRTPEIAHARFILWDVANSFLCIPAYSLAKIYQKDNSTIRHGITISRSPGMWKERSECLYVMKEKGTL